MVDNRRCLHFSRVILGFAAGMLGCVSILHAQGIAAASAMTSPITQRVSVDVERAPLASVLQLIARQAGLLPIMEEAVVPGSARVTLHVRDIPANEAFQEALRGTGLIARLRAEGYVTFVRGASIALTGVIMGTISDAKTKHPLRAAKIAVDGMDRTETGEDGKYRIAGVAAGSHTISVKILGYLRATRTVSVDESGVTAVDVSLDPSAAPLDQVVVTGTVIPTELKAVPNAITVISAKEIEQRGITRIEQLFRGDVPGVFALNTGSGNPLDTAVMFSRGASRLYDGSTSTNPIKTYVDGVELANPSFLSQIDPKSIERIEILTGPQASTIYGSNAINGVMQIFTKRGVTAKPQLTMTLLSGTLQNNFRSSLAPQHDDAAQVSGVEGRLSYNAGGTWQYIGHWSPAVQQMMTGAYGGVRFQAGSVTIDGSLRRSMFQNRQTGGNQDVRADYVATGYYVQLGSPVSLSAPTTSTAGTQTLGLSLGYRPTLWWSHDLVVGSDGTDTEQRATAAAYAFLGDTLVSISQSTNHRMTVRYATTLQVPIASWSQLSLTAGTDGWHNLMSAMTAGGLALTGTLSDASIQRQPGHNRGMFLQGQLSLRNAMFLTYGMRAEWNPNYGADVQPNIAPRYGLAYTHDLSTPFGPLTAKLRGSYGRSTRPPTVIQKQAVKVLTYSFGQFYAADLYGNYDFYLANPLLEPEQQAGGEGGLEFYLGNRASLVVTRYNQVLGHLITGVIVDTTVRSIRPLTTDDFFYVKQDSAGYGYTYQIQNINGASVRNSGWEAQGSVNIGAFTTKGTYSWTKSRVIGIDPKYAAQFAVGYPYYRKGSSYQNLPEHSWAVMLTYGQRVTSVTVGVNGTSQLLPGVATDALAFLSLTPANHGGIRLPQNLARTNNPRVGFGSPVSGYIMVDLNAVHTFTHTIDGVLQVQNLGNRYRNDLNYGSATLGRQTKGGVRIHL